MYDKHMFQATPFAPGVPLCFRVYGLECKVQGLRFRVQGSGFRVQGSGLRVEG
jgi:hypothetical protein